MTRGSEHRPDPRSRAWTRRALCLTAPLLAAAPPLIAQDRIGALDAQSLDWFGFDVASSGDWTVAGSWRDDDAGEGTGSAHVLYTPGTGSSAYVTKLVLEDAAAGDLAGMSVAIGDGVVLVAAPGRTVTRGDGSTIRGTVAVFEDVAGAWVQTAELDDPSRSEGDLFGSSMAVSDHGVLVGAPRDDASFEDGGAVYVYQRGPSGWVRAQKLVPVDSGVHDYFGHDVAAHGDAAVVGAYNDDDLGTNAGAAYTLSYDGSWRISQKLVASEVAGFDSFGTSVSIHSGVIAVSAPQNEDVDPDAQADEGVVVVYERSASTEKYVETMVLRPGRPDVNHRFGIDVAVGSDLIAVGASHADSGLLNAGSAHVFRRRGRDWFEVERYEGTTPQAYAYVGLSVSVGANVVVVGAPGADDAERGTVGSGAVDVFARDDSFAPWGSSYCHADEIVGGFTRMGGPRNSTGVLGRLCPFGSSSVGRSDLGLRVLGVPPNTTTAVFVGFGTASSALGAGSTLCIGTGGRGAWVVRYERTSAAGRVIVRDLIGAMASVGSATWAGETIYAQALYYGDRGRRWTSTNALALGLTP
ncbi:MAG: hypothetical protein AAFP86_08480 [Planctomycetota bacterium]